MFALGVAADEPSATAVRATLEAVENAVRPYHVGDYPNFVEEPADASTFFDPDTWARLREVKALYDPDDVFKGNHHIPPADRAHASAGYAAGRTSDQSHHEKTPLVSGEMGQEAA
jgi:hypothetical protein